MPDGRGVAFSPGSGREPSRLLASVSTTRGAAARRSDSQSAYCGSRRCCGRDCSSAQTGASPSNIGGRLNSAKRRSNRRDKWRQHSLAHINSECLDQPVIDAIHRGVTVPG